jgi:hypothetical protein
MLRLGRSLENESNLPGALAKCASDGLTCHEMLLALPQLPFTDDDLRGWQAELRTIDPPAAFRAALVGQRILDGLPLIDPLAEDPSFQPDLMWRLSRGNELQWYLDQVDLMIDATDRSWMEAKAVGNAISARLPVGPAPRAAAPGQAATLRLAPIFSASCSAVARWSANARATDAAIAAELYRRRNGTFPDRLDDLVPDFLPGVPRDPFDQQPLRYHPGDAACIIYSVGRNGRDDGGATHDDFEGDLLYELRAPPGAVAPVVVPAAAGGN